MQLKATARRAMWGLLLGAAMLPGALSAQSGDQSPQSRLPVGFAGLHGQVGAAAKPSAAVPASQLPAMPPAPPPPPPVPLTPNQQPAQRATVRYENGLVTVKANNSSLNQILRAIMRETGLQIDGGVTEERVYGVYGPAPLQTLLSNLLDGSDANIIYMPAMDGQPQQLTLTPRNGGTPPPPPSASASDDLLPDPVQVMPSPAPMPQNPPQTNVPAPAAAQPAPVPANPVVTPVPAPAAAIPAAVAGPPPAKPNTGHTAEDLVQQILQMRAAQKKVVPQALPSATPPAAAPAAAPPATPK